MRSSAEFDPLYEEKLKESLINQYEERFNYNLSGVETPDREIITPVPESENLAKPDPNQKIMEKTVEELERPIFDSITSFFKEIPRQSISGFGDAIKTAADIIRPIVPNGAIMVFDENGNLDIQYLSEKELLERGGLKGNIVFNEEEPDTAAGGMLRTMTRFLAGFVPTLSVMKALGVTHKLTQGILAGGLAEGIIFDPHQERLSSFLNEVPALNKVIPDYLADNSPDNESEWEGRLKNVIEGLGVGGVADSLATSLLSVMRRYKFAARLRRSEKEAMPAEVISAKVKENTEGLKGVVDEKVAESGIDQVFEVPLINPEDLLTKDVRGDVYLNTQRIDSKEDVQNMLQNVADLDVEKLTAMKTTFKEIKEESTKEFNDLYSLINREPIPMTRGQIVAAANILKASSNNVVRLARLAQGIDKTPTALYEYRKAVGVHNAIQEAYYAGTKSTAQSMAAMKIMAQTDTMRDKAIQQLISEQGFDIEKSARMIVDIADSGGNVSAAIDNMTRATFADSYFEVWVNGILSAFSTHGANIIGNTGTIAMSIPERYITSAYDMYFNNNGGALKEASARAYGMLAGIKDGISLLGKHPDEINSALRNSTVISESVTHQSNFTATKWGIPPDNVFGRGFDYIGKLIGLPTWALGKSDLFFKGINYRMMLQEQSVKTALEEGLTGKEFKDRVAHLVLNPTEAMIDVSTDFARYQTFTDPVQSKFVKGLMDVRSGSIGGRYVLPFIRTPSNILYYSFERTPLAPLHSKVREELAAGGVRSATAAAKISAGSLLMSSTIPLVLSGTITGGGPSDPRAAKTLRNMGWQEYSIKVGDKYYAYNRLEPIGTLMGYAADMISLRGGIEDDEASSLAGAAAAAFFKSLSNKTFVSSGVAFIDAADSGDPRKVERYFARMASTFAQPVYSNFNKKLNGYFDPVRRDYTINDNEFSFLRSTIEQAKENIPGYGLYGGKEAPPQRDAWGEVINKTSNVPPGVVPFIETQSPIRLKSIKRDPVSRMIVDNKIVLSFPKRVYDGVRLTNEEYSKFSELSGKLAKSTLDKMFQNKVFNNLSGGTDGAKAKVVNQVLEISRSVGINQMLANPEYNLKDRVREKNIETAKKLRKNDGQNPR